MSPGERVTLHIGTWPLEPGQFVWVAYRVEHHDKTAEMRRAEAVWQRNEGSNSYWRAEIGPFLRGERITYAVYADFPMGTAATQAISFQVKPKLYLALLWHQHQPIYKDTSHPAPAGSYLYPWVRLHAIRDTYSMAALVAGHPNLHLTINLTPSLLRQLEDYLDCGATDRALELTLTPAELLTDDEREYILGHFFDADWHNQIFTHPRYNELFIQRRDGRRFTVQDVRDLQMWFNLAWFGQEFRDGEIRLINGEVASVRRFVEQERNFSEADIKTMVAEQYKILQAIIPIHRRLQEDGQIEVSTTPFYHPILPLLLDTDRATIDRPGTTCPRRIAHPVQPWLWPSPP